MKIILEQGMFTFVNIPCLLFCVKIGSMYEKVAHIADRVLKYWLNYVISKR